MANPPRYHQPSLDRTASLSVPFCRVSYSLSSRFAVNNHSASYALLFTLRPPSVVGNFPPRELPARLAPFFYHSLIMVSRRVRLIHACARAKQGMSPPDDRMSTARFPRATFKLESSLLLPSFCSVRLFIKVWPEPYSIVQYIAVLVYILHCVPFCFSVVGSSFHFCISTTPTLCMPVSIDSTSLG